MREILFRGKTSLGTWVFGDLVHRVCTTNIGHIIYPNSLLLMQYVETTIIPETVGQFTGATDRGLKVFEHDKVTVECEEGEFTGVIQFELGSFIIATDDDEDGFRFLADFIDTEGNLMGVVIGNTHQQVKEQS